MSADLALQKAIRARLTSTTDVTSLVPATGILDSNSDAVPDPCVLLGEGYSGEGNRIDRRDQQSFMDVHVWKTEPSTAGVKAIAGAIRAAIHIANFAAVDGYEFADVHVTTTRFLRDPDGVRSHAVVTVSAVVSEDA